MTKAKNKTEYTHTLKAPRVTEKASVLMSKNVYVFEIESTATKKSVAKAVAEYHKVKPKSVRIVKNPAKRVFVRGKRGSKPGVKKAYVYLKDGDKIE